MAVSDEFNSGLQNYWTEYDPDNTGTFSVSDGQLHLNMPEGISTNLWHTLNNSPRLTQEVTEFPIDISTKISAVPPEDGNFGILISNETNDIFTRLDYLTDGGTTRMFCAHVYQNGSTPGANVEVPGNPLYLRIVMLDSTSATFFHSIDGESWTELADITWGAPNALIPAKAGVFGSTPYSPYPEQTYSFEYVRFDLEPGDDGINIEVPFFNNEQTFFPPVAENQPSLNISLHMRESTFVGYAPSLTVDSSQTINAPFRGSQVLYFSPAIIVEGSDVFEPILAGEGSLADQIMAGLAEQGFVFGSITDREYQRLLSKLGMAYTGNYTIMDLYTLAEEPPRIIGLED